MAEISALSLANYSIQWHELIRSVRRDMTETIKISCRNSSLIDSNSINNKNPYQPMQHQHQENQMHAVLYIVTVLLFYAVTLAALLIKYMKQEKRSAAEEKMYQDFLIKTKQLAAQQLKRDHARRVSVQLIKMASDSHLNFLDVSHLATVNECEETSQSPTAVAAARSLNDLSALGSTIDVFPSRKHKKKRSLPTIVATLHGSFETICPKKNAFLVKSRLLEVPNQWPHWSKQRMSIV
uniref:Uncharacterized protein n=1 Tax=Romanomermis culicivorax TaxID=13658 RepID=A0A915KPM5_ROMCU